MSKMNSLKNKLLLLIMLSTIVSFTILGFYNANKNYNMGYNNIKQEEVILAQSTAAFINSYLQAKSDIIVATADEISELDLNISNTKIIEKLRLGSKSGKFAAVYIGFENNGNFLRENGLSRQPHIDKYDSRLRPWYTKVVKSGLPSISDPYVDFTTKKLVISVSAPIKKDGKIIAVVGSDIFIDTIVNSVLHIDFKTQGIAYLLNNEGKIIIHPNQELLKKEDPLYNQYKTKQNSDFKEVSHNGDAKLIAYNTIDSAQWQIIINMDKDSAFEEINFQMIKEIILYLILLVAILTIVYFTLIKILTPLKSLEKGLQFFFKYLKGEESNINKLNINTNDEFGNMANMIDEEMEIISTNINQDRILINNVKEVVSHVQNGKLDMKVNQSTSNQALNDLKDILNDMIETINKNVNSDINPILSQLEEYAKLNFVNTIENADGDISRGLNNLCTMINKMLQENKANGLALDESSKILLANVTILHKSSNETAVSLEETAAAIEQITRSISNNTSRISEMSLHSKELSVSIKEGQDLATSTVISMDEINEQTGAIADAITVIDQIAFQTNILSLNAAVEAATAGEAGKGFAVVAQEVRNLAARSAEAAKKIKDLVENATSKTNNGKVIADRMILGYEKLNENIIKSTNSIVDIAESSKEQQLSIEQINDVINKLDQQTQNNAAVANETQAIATKTSTLSQIILQSVNEKSFRESK